MDGGIEWDLDRDTRDYAKKLSELFDKLDDFGKAMVYAYCSGMLAAQDRDRFPDKDKEKQ